MGEKQGAACITACVESRLVARHLGVSLFVYATASLYVGPKVFSPSLPNTPVYTTVLYCNTVIKSGCHDYIS